jgi:hypothetical protein
LLRVAAAERWFTNRNYQLQLTQPVFRMQNWLQYDQAEQQVRQAEAAYGQAGQHVAGDLVEHLAAGFQGAGHAVAGGYGHPAGAGVDLERTGIDAQVESVLAEQQQGDVAGLRFALVHDGQFLNRGCLTAVVARRAVFWEKLTSRLMRGKIKT